jgi:hypothetical protein
MLLEGGAICSTRGVCEREKGEMNGCCCFVGFRSVLMGIQIKFLDMTKKIFQRSEQIALRNDL